MLDFLFTLRFLVNDWAFESLNRLWSLVFLLYFFFLFGKKKIKIDKKALLAFALFNLYIVFFLLSAPSRILFLRQYYIFSFGFLAYLLGLSLDSQKIAKAFIFSAFIAALLSLHAFYFANRNTFLYLSSLGHNTFAQRVLSQKRAFFPFLLPNSLGSFMALVFIVNLGLEYKKREKAWQFVAGALFLFLVFLSRSLGVLLCLFIVLLVYFLQKRRKKSLFLFILSFLLMISLVFFLRQHSAFIFKPSFSLFNRLIFLKKALFLIIKHPFLGVGAGGYYLYSGVMYCHNVFLQMWLAYGILGFFGFLLVCIYFLIKSFRLVKNNPGNIFFLSLALANVFFLLHNLIDIDFYVFQLSFLWFILLGIIGNNSKKIA